MFGLHPLSIFIFLSLAFWLWMMVDCLLNKSLRDAEKVLWFLLIFFTQIAGAIIYFIIGRAKKKYGSSAISTNF